MDDCMGVYVQAGLQWREVDELSRNALEVEAEFLGLIIMQNLGISSHTSTSPSAAMQLLSMTSYNFRLACRHTLFPCTATKIPFMYSLLGIAHIHVSESDLYISRIGYSVGAK
jgi:hypothetical protein